MNEHNEFIYRNAAFRHRFIDSPNIPLANAKIYRMQAPTAVANDWKSFCASCFQLENSWRGYGPSVAKFLPEIISIDSGVLFGLHRLKLDEDAGLLITTHVFGGLSVVSLQNVDRPLWCLSVRHVRQYAHVEYDRGFIVFDRMGGGKEVWRHAVDYDPMDVPLDNLPDADQFQAEEKAMVDQEFGRFVPWALLSIPELTRAYRFVYPTLLVAGYDHAFLYDIPTARLVQTINISGVAAEDFGDLRYVELSNQHVFICFEAAILVFDRNRRDQKAHIINVSWFRSNPLLSIYPGSPRHKQWDPKRRMRRELIGLVPTNGRFSFTNQAAEACAVHTSPCGNHLAILLSDNRLVLVEQFRRLFTGEAKLEDIATDIVFGSIAYDSSCYLAFHDDKVGVATHMGIFVVTLDSTRRGIEGPWTGPNSLEGTGRSFPNLLVTSVHGFDKPASLRDISCLQLTRTGMFFPYQYFKPEQGLIPISRSPISPLRLSGNGTPFRNEPNSDTVTEFGVDLGDHEDGITESDRNNIIQAFTTARLCCVDFSVLPR